MEYLQAAVSTRHPPEEQFRNFLKIFLKIPKKTLLTKPCFKNDGDSRPVNFLKHNHHIKTMTFVAYMVKIISLTGTPHSHEL